MATNKRVSPRAQRTITTSIVISRELHEWWAGEGGECDRQRRSFTAIVESLLEHERRNLLGLPPPMPRLPAHLSGIAMMGYNYQPTAPARAPKPAPKAARTSKPKR